MTARVGTSLLAYFASMAGVVLAGSRLGSSAFLILVALSLAGGYATGVVWGTVAVPVFFFGWALVGGGFTDTPEDSLVSLVMFFGYLSVVNAAAFVAGAVLRTARSRRARASE